MGTRAMASYASAMRPIKKEWAYTGGTADMQSENRKMDEDVLLRYRTDGQLFCGGRRRIS